MVTYVFVWSVTVFIFFAANVTFYIITTTHAPNEMCRSELYYYISGFKMEEAEYRQELFQWPPTSIPYISLTKFL